ncbi:hypothetical protein M1L60_09165 [Actinoplanes sp. TRM 88003]|uniref:CARDB domain-containing protein n=1 Tax=Paractinoplanes aksuensis TaxID=2939490 RepID=A0ABT1DJV2_9ACTN|nr:hypothetical protein [Actinoplanes aksuensis]MCO8270763.1 hypothetical protein [Actinoplanes aksuensis]
MGTNPQLVELTPAFLTRLRRVAAWAMVVMLTCALPPSPAHAAPAGVEGEVHLRNLTLPADGSTVEEILSPLLFADEQGWADSVTLTIDTSQVGVAVVKVVDSWSAAKCSSGPVVRCVLPGPHRVFERPKDDGAYGYVTFGSVPLSLIPKPGVSIGDTGTLSVATKVDDGPATIETSTVRIGEAVNLTAVDEEPQTVAPGGAVTLRPKVRNTGPTPVDGLTAVISADPGALAGTNFSNCTYGYAVACTFDTTMAAGSTYGMAAPITLRVPGDAAGASQTMVGVQWMTAAEWEDWLADYGELPQDRAGTGPELELEEMAVSAAGAPQADTDHDDNGSYTTVTVSGRRTDLVAVGATVPGTAAEHTFSVGLVNQGPGTLRYPPFSNNVGSVRVTLPAPMSVIVADDRCRSESGDLDPPPSSAPDEPPYYGPPVFSSHCGRSAYGPRNVSCSPSRFGSPRPPVTRKDQCGSPCTTTVRSKSIATRATTKPRSG